MSILNTTTFNNKDCNGTIEISNVGDVTVNGSFSNIMSNPTLIYWSANPPTYNNSFSGSCLPYPNEDVAFNRTLNKGRINNSNGTFNIKLKYPNSYYTNLGTIYTPPCLFIKILETGQIYKIPLGQGSPFRMLTYPSLKNAPRVEPGFYYRRRLPIRTQEQILLDSGYPSKNVMPENFWGLTVPHC